MKNIKQPELLSLILMLIPFVSVIGFVIYVVICGAAKNNMLKLIIAVLTIFLGIFAAIFLWLDALDIINLDNKK